MKAFKEYDGLNLPNIAEQVYLRIFNEPRGGLEVADDLQRAED